MIADSAIKDDNYTSNPLGALSTYLSDDMQKVNGLILKHMESDIALIPQIAQYLIAAGGKRIRPLLTLAATRLFIDDSDRPHGLAASVEFIHTATLLHDDVVDESTERRGQDTANIVFGNQASVLVGDFLFSRAFQLMVADGSLEVLKILSEASATIAEGEVLQLQTAGQIDITMQQYYQIISSKTAALFAASCEIGPVIAGETSEMQTALRDYGYHLGMAFQISDDILDYKSSAEDIGKTPGDDFREGKITLPVLLAMEKANEEEMEFWTRTLSTHNQNDDDFEKALSILKKYNTLDASLQIAQDHAQKAEYALSVAPGTAVKEMLNALVNFTVQRSY